MPDILSVCMQDILYSRQPELREGEITVWQEGRLQIGR